MACKSPTELLANGILGATCGKIISVSEAKSKIAQIAHLVLSGGVIAVPTDTIYGVACSVTCPSAFARIRRLKGRAPEKPMAICLDQVNHISDWCDTKGLPEKLLSDLLPGPVTVLLSRPGQPATDRLGHLNPGISLVGVRIPEFGLVRDLVSAMSKFSHETGEQPVSFSTPLVLTSANLSGASSAVTVHDFDCLWPSLDLIIDGGDILHADGVAPSRAGSTIVDLSRVPSEGTYSIVRDGSALTQTTRLLEEKYGLCRIPIV